MSDSTVMFTGGRDYITEDAVHAVLASLIRRCGEPGVDHCPISALRVVVGDCPTGLDNTIRRTCYGWNIEHTIYRADWDAHGRAAGPLRNSAMLREGKPDVCYAFPGGRGTADAVRCAVAAGVRVHQYDGAKWATL